eukprot:g7579.t1
MSCGLSRKSQKRQTWEPALWNGIIVTFFVETASFASSGHRESKSSPGRALTEALRKCELCHQPRNRATSGEEPPRGRTWALPRLRLPGLPKPSWRESARWTGIVAASFSFAALLQQHELWSFMCLLKDNGLLSFCLLLSLDVVTF